MFRFLFKRSAKSVLPPVAEQTPVSAPDRRQEKAAAIARASGLQSQEDAVEFILHCNFAEARLIAAQSIATPALLERVRHAMRDTDRRVARLMQSRLDEYNERLKCSGRANECVDQAKELVQQPRLLASDVTTLDRSWQALTDVPADTREAFEYVREQLARRLLVQTALQRQLIDTGNRLNRIAGHLSDVVDIAAHHALLETLASEVEACCRSPEASSLPASLIASCEAALRDCRDKLAAAEEGNVLEKARDAALSGWEQMDPAALEPTEIERRWHAMPGAAQAEQQRRYQSILQTAKAARLAKVSAAAPEPAREEKERPRNDQAFDEALADLEKALDNGALQAALAHDRVLRSFDAAAAARMPASGPRLAAARARLNSLKGWARWGGAVSREELLVAAQELPSREDEPQTLADRVGDLRRQWKALDASAGPASRELWDQFDAACTLAYAPAAAHFAALAAERQANLSQAEKLIADVNAFAKARGLESCADHEGGQSHENLDWKEVARFCSRTKEAWKRLGPIGRREKKQFQIRLDAALSILLNPLESAQQSAAQRRENLIANVRAVDPLGPDAMNRLRALQQSWQAEAKSLPLPQNDEQVLWTRFREACDSLAAQRRKAFDAADEERRRNLQLLEELIGRLEAAASGPVASVPAVLREASESWSGVGEVPRDARIAIDARYRKAVAVLRQQAEKAEKGRTAARWSSLIQRLALCRRAEQALLDGMHVAALHQVQKEEWASLPPLPAPLQQALQARFDRAVSSQDAGLSFQATLQANREALLREVLRLEILSGTESPATLSRQRLEMQVGVLQAAMKAGRNDLTLSVQIAKICGLAAASGESTAERIDTALKAIQQRHPELLGAC